MDEILQMIESIQTSIYLYEDRVEYQGIEYLDSEEDLKIMKAKKEVLEIVLKQLEDIYERLNKGN